MNAMRMVTLLSLAALTSCAPFSKKNKDKAPGITDTQIITQTEYLPGATTVATIDQPDSKIMVPCDRLAGKDIPPGPDIDGATAVKVAASWGKTANDCRDKNLILIGWIQGVTSVSLPTSASPKQIALPKPLPQKSQQLISRPPPIHP